MINYMQYEFRRQSMDKHGGTHYSARIMLVLVLLFSLVVNLPVGLSVAHAQQSQIPEIEYEALVALYEATDGENWINKWTLPTEYPCELYGVICDYGHVYGLFLNENHLSGSIPPELGNLENLFQLFLNKNQLTGPIPPELGNLVRLYFLNLRANQLSGPIPSELGNLVNLFDLYLDGNQLNEQIPPELGNLDQLLNLYLGFNQLSGPIPPELGNLGNLVYLNLRDNQLSGPIPPELSNLENLSWLGLDSNQLSGPIPPELGNLENLLHLYLGFNQLSGSIPPELGNFENLDGLGLYNNQLSGTIPPELGNLENLWTLTLMNNQLSGAIPPELGNLINLSTLLLSGNQLSGLIPSELSNLENLSWLDLRSNQLDGPIPPELGNLANLSGLILYNNQLTGTIPPELGNLENLSRLSLSGNKLEGDVPESFANLVNLADPAEWYDGLDLDYNFLNVPPDYPNPANPLHVFLNQKDPDWHLRQGFQVTLDPGGGEFQSLDGKNHFLIPDGALAGETTFTFYPQANPSQAYGSLLFANNSFLLEAEDEFGMPVTTFDAPLTATILYDDQDIEGLPEDFLGLYLWDETSLTWMDAVTTCPEGEYLRDPEANSFSLPVCHLSEFAVFVEYPHQIYLPVLQR
jgi:Leucine-rich repeat (LRR) protein